MTPETKKAVLEVMSMALDLNRETFAVFVDYSGHVNKLSVRCYPGGWECAEQSESSYLYVAGSMASKVERLTALKDWMNGMSNRGYVAPASAPQEKLSYYQRNKDRCKAYMKAYHARKKTERAAKGVTA